MANWLTDWIREGRELRRQSEATRIRIAELLAEMRHDAEAARFGRRHNHAPVCCCETPDEIILCPACPNHGELHRSLTRNRR